MSKEIEKTPEQIKEDLINDLFAVVQVMDEVWRYHPENPNKLDIIKEYRTLETIKSELEEKIQSLT
tara:strand:- start:416 stop:613 length:198 start_codon:yes stop_codon:yes gene_type:complete